jgi:thiol-disulfide isomerase/thioredoxin
VTTAVIDERARIPRPVAFVIVGAILGATLLALFWPSLPLGEGRRIVVGPTRVGVIDRQIDNGGSGRVGAAAPDFEWIAPDGKRLSLGGLGRPAVVNFWATWCVPCRKEMPLLDSTATAHPEVSFLAIDLDEDGTKVRAFFDEVGIARLDPLLDVGLAVSRRYGLASAPSTFFVDAKGTIRHVQIGEMDQDKIQRGLDRIR